MTVVTFGAWWAWLNPQMDIPSGYLTRLWKMDKLPIYLLKMMIDLLKMMIYLLENGFMVISQFTTLNNHRVHGHDQPWTPRIFW